MDWGDGARESGRKGMGGGGYSHSVHMSSSCPFYVGPVASRGGGTLGGTRLEAAA